VTFDTSALLSLFDRRQSEHGKILELAESNAGQLIIPIGIMAEISYFVEHRMGQRALVKVLNDIRFNVLKLDSGINDIDRISELVERYLDMPLGYADAAVIACAERHGGRVATLDHRHLDVVAREGIIQIVP